MRNIKDWLLGFMFNTAYVNQKTGEVTNKEGEIIDECSDREINLYALKNHLYHKKHTKP